MLSLLHSLAHEEHGFVVSAELVLIGTIGILAMVVGLSEVSNAVNGELSDVAAAFDATNTGTTTTTGGTAPVPEGSHHFRVGIDPVVGLSCDNPIR